MNTVDLKIVTVVGARPQFIKAALLSRQMRQHGIQEVLVHTGQHFDANMSDVFFKDLDLPQPDYHLGVSQASHGKMTAQMMEGIEEVLIKESPDAVLVYGDTNSTLAGALVAVKMGIKLIHVEAGLRSGNKKMAEEINRILTDRVSDLLFCPSQSAMDQLRAEGIGEPEARVVNTGDIMYDQALITKREINHDEALPFGLKHGKFILCTLHRAENVDYPERLKALVDGINLLAERQRVVLPLHPRTKKSLDRLGLKFEFDTCAPMGYHDMVKLLEACSLVVTDSGGLQKESYFFEKKCLVMRDETEWNELLDIGANHLVTPDPQAMIQAYENIKTLTPDFGLPIYGDGHAAEMMVEALLTLKGSPVPA